MTAVMPHSGTPTRLPARSSGFFTLPSARTKIDEWRKMRDGNTGMAIALRSPPATIEQ